MSRLHDALQRSTGGNAPIVPPDAGTPSVEEILAGQPASSVPWALDAGPAEAPAGETAAGSVPLDAGRGRSSLSPVATGGGSSRMAEKLVGAEISSERPSLGVAVEQYRRLAASLHHAQAERGLKIVVVTSAGPGEGKSLTATNLAITLSESYQRRVLLLDGDLRRPSLHDILGVPNTSGLSDGLSNHSVSGLAAIDLSPRLSVLTSGRPLADPTRALTSEDMKRVLIEARTSYDWTIIDTPPVGMLTDAKLLAEMVDAVLLVVEAEKTPYPDLLRVVEALGRERILGVVLNRLRHVSEMSRYYAGYYQRAAGRGA